MNQRSLATVLRTCPAADTRLRLACFAFSTLLVAAATVSAAAEPVTCDKDYAALAAAEIATIHASDGALRKVLVDGIPEDQLSPEDNAALETALAIQESRSRYVDTADLDILVRALEILASLDVWNRHDTRECHADDRTFSLFCALHRASIDVVGEYEHRRTALQEVRFAIEEARPGVEYEHRMQDFNNEEKTTFAEVRGTIETARARVADRLRLEARCEF
jgi:hypothetical protein